jgi:signal transduction histidine kinase/DNA-binding response OmpR family regulator/ligand-binding sensor domain-containing protein
LKTLLLILIGFLPLYLQAAEKFHFWITAPYAYRLYQIQQFKYRSGLADPTASRIMEDSYGFIWFGTVNALISFDGYHYTAYDVNSTNSSGLTGHWVVSLFEDRDRNIWAGTCGGLNRLNRSTGQFSHFFPDTSDISGSNNVIRYIDQDKNGHIWLITNRNIYRLDPVNGKFTEFDLDSLAWLKNNTDLGWVGTKIRNAFLQDHQGKIWIGTPNGLFFYDPATGNHTLINKSGKGDSGLSHDYITAVVEDDRKNIWISTMGGGLNLLTDRKRFAFRKFRHDPMDTTTLCSDSILSLAVVHSGNLWIGSKGSISLLSPGPMNFRSWIIQDFPPEAMWAGKISVHEIFEDHNGGIWIFNRNTGVARLFFNERLLVFQDIPSDLQQEICMDRAGSFWIGTYDKYAFRIDLQAPRIMHSRYDYIGPWIFEDSRGTCWVPDFNLVLNSLGAIWKINPANLPGNISFTAMYESSDGNLWFASNAIYKYNPVDRSLVTFRLTGSVLEKIKESRVEYIRGDQNGNLWFGNKFFLAFLNTSTGKCDLISPVRPILITDHQWQIQQVLVDSHHTVWIATLEGICRIEPDKENRFTRFVHDPDKQGSLGDNAAFRIAEDRLGRLWVLTLGSGLHLFNRDSCTFRRYKLFQDIPDITFTGMVTDLNKDLWIFHTAGMSRFSPPDGAYKNFSLPFSSLNATINQLRSGNIYMLPTAGEGTYFFHPDSIIASKYIPPVYITSLLINNKPFINILDYQQSPVKRLLKLNYRNNSLLFAFSALNYTEPENNRYKYRMIGQDGDTLQAGRSHTVEYGNLRPGKYTFWVTGSNNDGFWNPEGTSVSFVIRSPWFWSWIAWVVYGLLFLLALYTYIRWRTSALITEKAALESQVIKRTQQIEDQKLALEQRNQQILELDRIKTRFFANISHEFRTPLTLIQGPVEEMLEQHGRSEKERNFLSLIYKNTRRLLNLVNQLLDIAKIDSSNMKLELTEADVIDFLRTIAASFSSLAETRHISYSYQLPIVVRHTWFDRDKIEKIVNNLLSNAFKFTPEGGSIILKANYVTNREGLPESLVFSVSDTGIGIPAELTEKIFDRFYQVEESLKRDGSGTGLGLSLTRDLIELMHGEITVHSEPGKGSIFMVRVPLKKDHLKPEEYTIVTEQADLDQKIVRPLSPREIVNKNADLQVQPVKAPDKPIVLIVEDNKDIRQHIMGHFDHDFGILEATDGRAGLHLAIEAIPDLVITDLMMPHMDGIEFCRQLKSDERTSHIPVIMLTARASLPDKLQGLVTGADDYISKPFNMKELLVRSENLVTQRRKLRERFSREITLEPRDIVVTSLDEQFLRRAIAVAEKYLADESFSVNRFSDEMNMSKSTLFRKLYALTGQSSLEFINTIRLKRAASLLQQGFGSVTTVALEVGFSNPSHFAKIFKKQFGISPRTFIKSF